MATITYQIPHSTLAALRLSPDEFAREMKIAASVQWYAQGLVSQGKAAELAGLDRNDFLGELFRRKIPASQASFDDLVEEIEHE